MTAVSTLPIAPRRFKGAMTIAAIVTALGLGGCISPEQQAANDRLQAAMSHMSQADYAECELVARMRPRQPGEGTLEQVASFNYTSRLCLKAKLYRAGYVDYLGSR